MFSISLTKFVISLYTLRGVSGANTDRANYQEKVMSTRNTNVIFKHLKSLKKSPSLPKTLTNGIEPASTINDKVNMLNSFLQSVYSPKEPKEDIK